MSPLSYRQTYMGMIRSVVSWGLEVGWDGQREWREILERLQYAALRKCTGAVVGARKESVRKVATVESVEIFAHAMVGRLLARSMCGPGCAGVAENADSALEVVGGLSLGGFCSAVEIVVVDLEVDSGGTKEAWEEAIKRAGSGSSVAFNDGSRDDAGRVARG